MKVKVIKTSCYNGKYCRTVTVGYLAYISSVALLSGGDLGTFPWLAGFFGSANVPLMQAVYFECFTRWDFYYFPGESML